MLTLKMQKRRRTTYPQKEKVRFDVFFISLVVVFFSDWFPIKAYKTNISSVISLVLFFFSVFCSNLNQPFGNLNHRRCKS